MINHGCSALYVVRGNCLKTKDILMSLSPADVDAVTGDGERRDDVTGIIDVQYLRSRAT